MHRKGLFFVFLLFCFNCFAAQYGLGWKVGEDPKITKLQIFSERCSGTNYTRELLLNNLNTNRGNDLFYEHFLHPHFPPWLELPIENWHGRKEQYTFEGTEDILFIILFRNPYDWLRSFAADPMHSVPKLQGQTFSNFIRLPWEIRHIESFHADNPLLDRNPKDGSLFRNSIELRNAKTKNFLEIPKKVANVYFINYEIARDFPEEVLAEIASLFNLRVKDTFSPIRYYRGHKYNGLYRKINYGSISEEDLEYINFYLDEELENTIGYEIVLNSSNIK